MCHDCASTALGALNEHSHRVERRFGSYKPSAEHESEVRVYDAWFCRVFFSRRCDDAGQGHSPYDTRVAVSTPRSYEPGARSLSPGLREGSIQPTIAYSLPARKGVGFDAPRGKNEQKNAFCILFAALDPRLRE